MRILTAAAVAALSLTAHSALAAGSAISSDAIFAAAHAIQPKVVAWRRDIHEHPELGNREFRTSAIVAAELTRLGFEVRTKVATTGIVAVLKGGKPGGVVALRADMDALPVYEKTGLPFASKVTADYDGQTVGVMHACGHDTHVAMLLGAATVLSNMRANIPGTVVLIFQPAEEGLPLGEVGGAKQMVLEGALENPAPSAIFGIHIGPGDLGKLNYRAGGFYAASDRFDIALKGRQTHGARPWDGIDVLSLGASIVTAFNQIAARQINVTSSPTVLTVATIHGGVRNNIIPEELKMSGTLRTFTDERRTDVIARMEKTVQNLAESYGANATLTMNSPSYPVTYNDPDLAKAMLPTLTKAAGRAKNVEPEGDLVTGSEDFSFYARKIPGVFYQLGGRKPSVEAKTAPANHSPYFDIDETVLEIGVRTHVLLALDYLASRKGK
jgi:amidohydrolase